MPSFKSIGHEITKLCSRQAENVKMTIKEKKLMTAWCKVMVLVHCALYYCTRDTCHVSSQSDTRWKSYALDKKLDVAHPYAMGDPIICAVFHWHIRSTYRFWWILKFLVCSLKIFTSRYTKYYCQDPITERHFHSIFRYTMKILELCWNRVVVLKNIKFWSERYIFSV